MTQKKPEMGKWLLYRFFHKNPAINAYLPQTKKFTPDTASSMLNEYEMIYVKPVAGSRGNGIIKVWREGSKRIIVKRTIEKSRHFSSPKHAIRHVDGLRKGKMYIVQRGIQLAKVNGRPFDIRIMMQRDKPGGKWLYSGMVAKIAGRNSVVTNTALSKGRVVDVKDVLKQSFGWKDSKIQSMMRKMERFGLAWAKHFDDYQLYRELGFDVAIDTRGKVWLIEQNTAPSHALFAKNRNNLEPYRRIQYRYGVFERARKKKVR